MAVMKRPSYHAGVAWIARNVTTAAVTDTERWYHPLDAFDDRGRVAVALLSEMFGQTPERVAGDALRAVRVPA